MISVYPSNERNFADNGIKILKPIKAMVHKEDNGDYYLDLKDTIDNIDYYQQGMIIRANTPWGYQGFRLGNPDVEGNRISIRAKHLYFDSENYLIRDCYIVDKNCNDALDHLNINCDITTPFTFLSDISRIASYRCIRHTLEEAIAVIIERWGGHLVRDNFNIEVRDSIGSDNGIVISYAKNISKLSVNEKWDDVVTKLLPVGKDGLTLPETYLTISDDLYDIPYSKIISFQQDHINEDDFKDENGILDEEAYEEALIEDLRQQGNDYLEANKFPKVNYSVNAYIDKVSDVGDVIYLHHPRCHVDLTTNVIAIDYDCIKERYEKIEFGNFKSKLKDLINKVTATIDDKVEESTGEITTKLQSELQSATNRITSLMNESYVIYDGNQILIVDSLPKESATNVIRVNSAGIGFSQTGINGTFNSAWSINGTLDMQHINVINLIADMIKGGTLKLGSNLNESGIIELYDESNRLISTFDKNGLIFYCDDNSYIKINPLVGFAGYDANDQKTYWVDGDEFHQRKSVVEEEITIANKMREIPITIYDNNNNVINDGVGFVALV